MGINQVKVALVIAAVVIASASLIVSQALISDLRREEIANMEVWAEATRALNTADETTDISLVLTILGSNNTIPVIVTSTDGKIADFRNIDLTKAKTAKDTTLMLKSLAANMQRAGQTIRININQPTTSSETTTGNYLLVNYDQSLMLKRLESYPYIQLGVISLFVVVAIFALLSSKRAEQNMVWVGLSKETAHQLGTPISSLMAWSEVLREQYQEDELIPEMEKDIQRLQLIAERFSKIGSTPELIKTDLLQVINNIVIYIRRRTSDKVQIKYQCNSDNIQILASPPLLEWVIEVLCKNAIDAMSGKGSINITVVAPQIPEKRSTSLMKTKSNGSRIRQIISRILVTRLCRRRATNGVTIYISDTGKGIPRSQWKTVFKPGFTTKRRGWGLGLSLAKRIIEEYHHGYIYIKESCPEQGTTFAIQI